MNKRKKKHYDSQITIGATKPKKLLQLIDFFLARSFSFHIFTTFRGVCVCECYFFHLPDYNMLEKLRKNPKKQTNKLATKYIWIFYMHICCLYPKRNEIRKHFAALVPKLWATLNQQTWQSANSTARAMRTHKQNANCWEHRCLVHY